MSRLCRCSRTMPQGSTGLHMAPQGSTPGCPADAGTCSPSFSHPSAQVREAGCRLLAGKHTTGGSPKCDQQLPHLRELVTRTNTEAAKVSLSEAGHGVDDDNVETQVTTLPEGGHIRQVGVHPALLLDADQEQVAVLSCQTQHWRLPIIRLGWAHCNRRTELVSGDPRHGPP